jgi:flagellar biosynthesis protein FlhB
MQKQRFSNLELKNTTIIQVAYIYIIQNKRMESMKDKRQKNQIGGVPMKSNLMYFVPIMSFVVFSFIIATYFMENIFSLMNAARINFSTILPNPDLKILLFFSVIGIFSIRRNRKNKLSCSSVR